MVADESASEGNAELKAPFLKKNSTRKELEKTQNTIEMRIKHRYKSQADEKVLSKTEKGKQF